MQQRKAKAKAKT